jgi:ATP-dependent Clp protease ATP-binding subunit ClpA
VKERAILNATDSCRATFARSRDVALDLRQGAIRPLHLAIAALETPDELTVSVLQALGVAAERAAATLRRRARTGSYEVGDQGGPDLAYVKEAVVVLQGCQDEAAAMGHRFIHPLHVLLAVLRGPDAQASQECEAVKMSHAALRESFLAEVP